MVEAGSMPPAGQGPPVVLYDGTCNLCATSVGFILRRDRQGRFRFAALQSDAARRMLEGCSGRPADLSAVVLVEAGRCLDRSEAVIRIAEQLPRPWPALRLLRILPRRVRDLGYRLVARWRTALFGRRTVCMRSSPGYEDRFLT